MRPKNAVPLETPTPFPFPEPEPRQRRARAIRIARAIPVESPLPADTPRTAQRTPTHVDACDCLSRLARFLIWATRNANR